MKAESKIVQLKDGRNMTIRSAQEADAKRLIQYLQVTTAETPYLVREPEEVTITLDEEQAFIRRTEEAEREIMLIAELDGRHVGNSSLRPVGGRIRYAHRCFVAIALYQEFCHQGIGRILLEEILRIAKECGYEQAELEVVTDNAPAVCLYKKLGFSIWGTQPHNMKYKDGSYADIYLMQKEL